MEKRRNRRPAREPLPHLLRPLRPRPRRPEPASRPRDSEKNLNIFCWSEYIPQEIVDAFTKETGIKVRSRPTASNEEMLAKLFAGGGAYDLIQPSEYVIEGLIKEDMLAPIDHAR